MKHFEMGRDVLPLVQKIQVHHSLLCLLSFPDLQERLYHPMCVTELFITADTRKC